VNTLMTDMEKSMFERGYVSSRMAAYKLNTGYKVVLALVTAGKLDAIKVNEKQKFISIASIKAHYKESAGVFALHDWSDVIERKKDGTMHVRMRESHVKQLKNKAEDNKKRWGTSTVAPKKKAKKR
jgi:hypothetical protein